MKKICFFWFYIWLLWAGGMSVSADVLVFKNGNRLEVKSLVMGETEATYLVDNNKVSVPIQYIDVEATKAANDAVAAKQNREKEETSKKDSTTQSAKAPSHLTQITNKRTLTPEEIKEMIKQFKKRVENQPKPQLARNDTSNQPVPRMGQIPFSRDPRTGLMVVRCQLNGVTEDFIFDTGASQTAISLDLAHRAGIDIDYSDFVLIGTASGRTKGYLGTVETLTIGNMEVRNLTVTIIEESNVNLIGQDIMLQFQVVVDNNRSVISLIPR